MSFVDLYVTMLGLLIGAQERQDGQEIDHSDTVSMQGVPVHSGRCYFYYTYLRTEEPVPIKN